MILDAIHIKGLLLYTENQNLSTTFKITFSFPLPRVFPDNFFFTVNELTIEFLIVPIFHLLHILSK